MSVNPKRNVGVIHSDGAYAMRSNNMQIVSYEQRSQEWLDWRQGGIGASEAAAILGRSPWETAQELWERKLGLRAGPTMNQAMRRGVEFEDEARAFFEDRIGEEFTPLCCQHDEAGFIRASLDGISASMSSGLEIKIPGLKTHQMALAGKVPEYYEIQMQHQMLVTGLEFIWYGSYVPETKTGVYFKVYRDDEMISELWEAEHDFWQHVIDRRPMYSPEWGEAAALWLMAEADLANSKKAKELATERLRALMPDGIKKFKAAGVTASVWDKFNGYKWSEVAADLGLEKIEDLDKFRPLVLGGYDESKIAEALGITLEELASKYGTRSDEIFTVKSTARKKNDD